MRKLLLHTFVLTVLSIFLISRVKAQTTLIPDANFELALINAGLDALPINGSIPTANIRDLTILDVASKNINDLTGIQDFVSLTRLLCNSNNLTSLNVTRNTALTALLCDRNRITALDVTKNTDLISLLCSNNLITSLDLTKNTALRNLGVDDNQLQVLDITKNTALVSLGCGNNKLSSLDVSKNTALTSLGCETNVLKSLDVTKNTALTSFGFEKNQVAFIDLTKNPFLYSLVCYSNLLTVLDLRQNPILTILDCAFNKLTALDVTKNPELRVIKCMGNQLTELDISKNIALTNVWCFGNSLTGLDLVNNKLVIDFRCNNNQLTTLNLKNGSNNIISSMNAAQHNPGLKCIQVDDPVLSAGYIGWLKDLATQYNNYCSPAVSSFSPATACMGQSVIIKGTNLNELSSVSFGGVPAASYTILSGTSIEAIVGAGASGNVEVSTPGGTASIPGFIFKQSGPPATINITASANDICPGVPVTFTAVSANVGTTPSYHWKLNGVNVGGNSRTYTNNNFIDGDKVSCVMNTIKECPNTKFVNSDTITMIIKSAPEISFNPTEHAIAPGSSVILNATVTGSFVSYLWTPSTGLNDVFTLKPVASPQTTTIYNLNVIAANNCSADKKIKVTVHKYVRIPNSFTPNGDGINDIFRVPPGTDLDLQVFSVYDRLGNEIFKSTDINKGWDGTYKGQMASPGVYIYLLKGTDPRGDVFLRGTILVIK